MSYKTVFALILSEGTKVKLNMKLARKEDYSYKFAIYNFGHSAYLLPLFCTAQDIWEKKILIFQLGSTAADNDPQWTNAR